MNQDDRDTAVHVLSKKPDGPVPGVLVAHTTPGELPRHYLEIVDSAVIGRSEQALILPDTGISRQHIRLNKCDEGCTIEDLGSKNGTYLNGRRVTAEQRLPNQGVIQLGHTILVYHDDIRDLQYEEGQAQWGMAGRFHTRKLLRALTAFVLSPERGILLAGPAGAGKLLAATVVAKMLGREILVHETSRHDAEDSMTAALFGIRDKSAADTIESPGYIERADGGVLMLRDAHGLPRPMQQKLVSVIDDGNLRSVGDSESRPVDVRFVFTSLASGPTYGLTLDLLSRLKVVQVPPLSERMADIPGLFIELLTTALIDAEQPVAPVISAITGSHCLALMRFRFRTNNVRGMLELVDRVVTGVACGIAPDTALAQALSGLKRGVSPGQSESRLDDVTRKVNTLLTEDE